jgi:hypothetical protein
MEEPTSLLTSETGKILGGVLLFVGLSDIGIGLLVFKAKIHAVKQQIKPGWSPEHRQPYEQKLKSLSLVLAAIQSSGVLFVMGGIFLLTR